ncbi:MAG: hypothetical protein ACI39U_08855 [Candidatus Cryptobacteroides sp.]
MMKSYRIILTALTVILTAASCQENDPDVWTGGTASLTVKGQSVLDYDPLTWQMSTSENGTFVVFKEDASVWYSVTCETMPKERGDKTKACVKWVASPGANELMLDGISLTVSSIDEKSGLMTLVSTTNKFSAKVHQLR